VLPTCKRLKGLSGLNEQLGQVKEKMGLDEVKKQFLPHGVRPFPGNYFIIRKVSM
jgi:hypothetical protein